MNQTEIVRVERLELEQFRVYEDLKLTVPPGGMRIQGANGTGKSTLLEAIALLSTTRPRRGALDADLVRHESGVDLGVPPYARVVGSVQRGDATVNLEVFVQRSERRNTSKKLLRVAERPRRAADVVGLVPTVTFSPDDLELILGSPSVRRRFIDILLSQIDRRYLRYLSRYAKILAQRNGLLRRAASDRTTAVSWDEFVYWDEQLVALGSYIIGARILVLHQLMEEAAERFGQLSPGTGPLVVRYESTIRQSGAWWRAIAGESRDALDASQRIGSVFEQQLRSTRDADIARGATSSGPHRDDLIVTIAGREMSRFGSRGQQRLAVLAVKLAEIHTIQDSLGVLPITLLDDVLSELDERHRETLLHAACSRGGQVFITSTERHLLDRPELASLGEIVLVEPGVVAERAS